MSEKTSRATAQEVKNHTAENKESSDKALSELEILMLY